MTTEEHRGAEPEPPHVSWGDTLWTTVLLEQANIDTLDDRGPDYAAELARKLFGFIVTWAAQAQIDEESGGPGAQILLRVYDEIREQHQTRADFTALAIALGIIESALRREYGIDPRERYRQEGGR